MSQIERLKKALEDNEKGKLKGSLANVERIKQESSPYAGARQTVKYMDTSLKAQSGQSPLYKERVAPSGAVSTMLFGSKRNAATNVFELDKITQARLNNYSTVREKYSSPAAAVRSYAPNPYAIAEFTKDGEDLINSRFGNATIKPFLSGYYNTLRSKAAGRDVMYGTDSTEAVSEYSKLLDRARYDNPSGNLLLRGAQGFSGLIGQMGANYITPEAALSAIPGVGQGARIKNTMESSVGQTYLDLVKSGVPKERAEQVAQLAGLPMSALEYAQFGTIVNGLKKQAGNKLMTSLAGNYVKNLASETAQELGQEAVSIAAENYAKARSGIQTDDWGTIKDRMIQTGVDSALSLGLLNAASSGYNLVRGNYPTDRAASSNKPLQAKADPPQAIVPAAGLPQGRQQAVPTEFSQNALTPQVVQRTEDIDYLPIEQIEDQKRNQAEKLTAIGDRLGIKVRLFDGEPHFNGRYLDGEMAINVNSPQSMNYVFAHEFLHFLRAQERTQDLNRFENFVLEHSREFLGNADLKTLIDRKIEEYAQYGENLTPYQAKEELIADGVGRLFEDERAIERLARVDENLFMRAWHFVQDMIHRLRGTAEQARFIEAQRLFEKASRVSSGVLAVKDARAMMKYVGTDSNGIRHYESDYNGQDVSDQEILDNFKNRIATVFNLGGIHLNTQTGRLEVLGDSFTRKKNATGLEAIAGPTNKRVMMEHYNDLLDILENSIQVGYNDELLQRAKNPGKKIKPSHKDVLHWHTFRNEVVLNNVPYEVLFDIREKTDGNGYAYRIHLSKQKRLGSQPISISGIGQTPQSSNVHSVPQQNQTVNTKNQKFSFGDPLYEKRGRGYVGRSMSVNAQAAYADDEMPMSKWTKKAMLSVIDDILYDNDMIIDGIEKMSKDELRSNFLDYSAWHHTGALYNQTNFYKINSDKVIELAREMTDEEITTRDNLIKEARDKEYQKQKELENARMRERELKERFIQKYGFKPDSVANYIRTHPHTFATSKKGNQIVIFEFQEKEYRVPVDNIDRTLIGYDPDIESELEDGNDLRKYSFGSGEVSPINRNMEVDSDADVTLHGAMKTRGLYESAAGSERVHSSVRQNLLQNIEDEAAQAMYRVVPNSETRDNVIQRLNAQGFDQVEAGIEYKIANNEKMTAEDMATAIGLIEHYSKAGELEKSQNMIANLSVIATELGRAVQIMRLMKHSTPQGALLRIEKSLQKINAGLKPNQQITLSEDRITDILSSEQGSDDLNRAIRAAEAEISSKVPATWWDKWNAWRYLSMLGNPKTHIRNMVGNAGFMSLKAQKDLFGAMAETMISQFYPEMERTKTLKRVSSDMDLVAKALLDKYRVEMSGDGKENTQLDQRIFDNNLLEGARRINSMALEMEDQLFLGRHFKTSLAKYLTANGIKPTDIATIQTDRKGKRIATLNELLDSSLEMKLSRAVEYAEKEAQKATFRDFNSIAGALNRIKNFGPKAHITMDALMPFTTTPLNVLRRGYEYSPLGVIEGIRKAIDRKNGTASTADVIDAFSASLSGTVSLFALGMLLAAKGYITGDEGGEDDQVLNALEGEQNYSLNIGEHSYTLDWAAPLSLPFFLGVETYNATKGKGFLDGTGRLTDSLTKISDPMMNLSVLQSMNRITKAFRNTDSPSEGLGKAVTTAVIGYLNQGVPTIGGQFARVFDDTMRTKYVDKNSAVPEFAQSLFNDVRAKVPFASRTAPAYIDAFGREKRTGNIGQRVFQNMVSPGYYSQKSSDPISGELRRLYEQTGERGVIPKGSVRKANNMPLTSQEYEEYNKLLGSMRYSELEKMITSDYYKTLSADMQGALVQKAYEYTKILAEHDYLGKEFTNSTKWANEVRASGISLSEALAIRADMEAFRSVAGQDKVEMIKYNPYRHLQLTGADREKYILSEMSDLANRKYPYIKERGISDPDTYFMVYNIVKGSLNDQDYRKEDKIRDLIAIGLSERQAYSVYEVISSNKKWQ